MCFETNYIKEIQVSKCKKSCRTFTKLLFCLSEKQRLKGGRREQAKRNLIFLKCRNIEKLYTIILIALGHMILKESKLNLE